ncbi:hypothetical protein [Mycobacterium sp. 48b]|uniref:hypothetical protein n=1 Tax=Mycobacterium sp. 48b TaxID=3400426 RepID=UPI003AAD5460
MPDLSRNPDDYADPDAYAHAQALNAKHSGDADIFAIGNDDSLDRSGTEYAIEPAPGWCSEGVTDDIATAIENIVAYRDGARLITRTVTYGPWRYVTPEEIEAL